MNNIRAYRVRAGLTQNELARKINKTGASISLYESGDRVPPIPVAKAIGKALGCEWQKLFDEDG